jgi:glyoxylase-like metal-dependent hydrolase (beta-lactamase superfamily II)
LLAIAALAFTPWAASQTPSQSASSAQSGAPYTPPKSIDFSSKHNVMIRNEDGTLTPMDVPYYRSKLIAAGTWQIESDGDYSYLLEGDHEALAIDSGYGAGNIRDYLQTLTSKPVRYIANTHYHFDHTANDAYFDRAYMSAETAEKATIPYPSFAGINFPRNYPKVIIGDGYKFQLGNREVDVFVTPNHTPGGTVYLDKRSRILFSGDEIMEPNEPINVSVAQFAANMRKIAAHRSEFDRVAGGPGIFAASDVDKYLAAAEAVLAGQAGTIPAPRRQGGADGPGSPSPNSAEPSAPVIYNRRLVRPPDRPAGMGAPNENLRRFTYQDRGITYDIRHIQN